MRSVLLPALGTLGILLLASSGCAPAVRCGAGTTEVEGVCVAGAPDAGTPAAVGYESLAIEGGGVPHGYGERFVPVGLPVTFSVSGGFPDGTAELPPPAIAAGFSWKVAPEDGTAQLRAHDGVVEVTMTRPGPVTLSVEARTADGFPISSQLKLRGVAPASMFLRTVSVQDGPWFRAQELYSSAAIENLFNSFDGSDGPPPPAVVPVAEGAARLLTTYVVDLPIPDDSGGTVTAPVRFLLDPSRLTYTVESGTSAMVTADGVVRSAAAGETRVSVAFASAPPVTAPVRFVAPVPTTALFVAEEGPIVRRASLPVIEWNAPEGTVTLATVLATDPARLPTISFVGTMSGTTTTAFIVARHGNDPGYWEWLPWSTVSRTVLALPDGYTASDSGVLTMKEPGVGLHVFSSGGLSMPVLVRVPFPYGTSLRVRADPPSVSLPRPSNRSTPGACRDISLHVTLPGAAERPLTEIERLAVDISPSIFMNPGLDEAHSRPLHWCPSFFARPGSTQFMLGYLNGHTDVELQITEE